MTQPDPNYPPPPYIPGGQYAVQQGQVRPDGLPGTGVPQQGPQSGPGQREETYSLAKHGPIRIDRNKAAKPITWESFVYVGDTEYKVMKTEDIPPAVALQFIDRARERGELIAVADLIELVVQPSGMIKDLSSVPGIDAHEINLIMTVIADKLFAAGQTLSGK